MLDVAEEAIKDPALLLDEQVLEHHLFLFDDHLLHNLEEVTAKDWKKGLFGLQEAAK